MNNNLDQTMQFNLNINKEDLTKSILTDVYNALQEKGYNPINQLVGYLISGDPSYITTYNGAFIWPLKEMKYLYMLQHG